MLDSGTRELTRRGRAVPLSPKVFELLELLLERRPEAVAKDAIHDRLWPKSFVSESSLARLAAEARAALADDARKPRYLRTVFGFGYAFCGRRSRSARGSSRGSPATLGSGLGRFP